MLKQYIEVENYLIKNDIIANIDEYSKKLPEKKVKFIKKQIEDKNSPFNAYLSNIIESNNINELENIGHILNVSGFKLSFKVQNLNTDNIDIIKTYIKYSDHKTCSNKVKLIKAIINCEDEEGIDILLESNFITNKNLDKFINFAINSGKYKIVPKLMERKKL